MTEPTSVIYGLSCTCHPARGIRYVGQTMKTATERLSHHIYASFNIRWEVDYSLPVHRWIRKHGRENIQSTVLEVVLAEHLDEREKYWIAQYRTFGGDGLNLTIGGSSVNGYKHTDETKAKLRGRTYSDETRAKMSASAKLRGMSHIDEPARVAAITGEKNHNASLTESDVQEIKALLLDGGSLTVIASQYGVTKSAINHIKAGRSWKHVPWPSQEAA